MKKIIALLLAGILLCSGFVFAEEAPLTLIEEVYTEAEDVFSRLAARSKISLMSVSDLSVKEQLAERLLAAWENEEAEIVVEDLKISTDNFKKLYAEILDEHLDFYYVSNGYRYRAYTDGTMYSVLPNYTIALEEAKRTLAAIRRETENILFYIDNDMSDFDKVMAVHDYMVLNYHYDFSESPNHSITIMTDKAGVCQSYALAFLHIMHVLEIPCFFVGSTEMNHAWNLVQIDGAWYHIDLTWDDPATENHDEYFAEVSHTYALLSDAEISSMATPHYGYNLGGLSASSTRYDKAAWHSAQGSIVYLDGVEYYVDDKNLVDSNGNIIYKNLAGTDKKWNVSSSKYLNGFVGTGVAEYNGIIYFNTDTAIYTYNPKTNKTEKFSGEKYLCGLYIDKNVLRYSKYNLSTKAVYDAGSIQLDAVRYAKPYVKDGKVVAKVCKADDEPMKIFSFGGNSCQLADVITDGVTTVTFDAKEGQTLFFWTEQLRPLREAIRVSGK